MTMPVIEPVGDYELTRRTVRFRCEAPLPLPGRVVILRLAACYGIVVRVNDIGGDGCLIGYRVGKATGRTLGDLTEVLGSG